MSDETCPTCGKPSEEGEDKEDSFGWSKSKARVWRAVEEFNRDRPEPTHTLKIHPEFFAAMEEGRKTFEIRRGNDRIYKVGDLVNLREYLADKDEYTGREMLIEVTYVMHGPPLLPEDMWLMSVEKK
jgi:hypothetical protein